MEIRLGHEGPANERATIGDLGVLLTRDDLPHLTRLAVRRCSFGDDVCEALHESPLARRLERLDLTATRVSKAAIRGILNAAARFPRLKSLRLPADVAVEFLETRRKLEPHIEPVRSDDLDWLDSAFDRR